MTGDPFWIICANTRIRLSDTTFLDRVAVVGLGIATEAARMGLLDLRAPRSAGV